MLAGIHKRLMVFGFSAAIVGCWAFPHFWYSRLATGEPCVWFTPRTNSAGWDYSPAAISKSAERTLGSDEIFSGEYRDGAAIVRLFVASRTAENPSEIGLFVHTPDRCWTEAGWEIVPLAPAQVILPIGAVEARFERRLFGAGTNKELVYFAGFVGGQPLPYRLDHNLSVGIRQHIGKSLDPTGTIGRAADPVLWRRLWESFQSRRQLFGPKQFVRISTPVSGEDAARADELLRRFLAGISVINQIPRGPKCRIER